MKATDHPTVYIVGDSIWNEEVQEAIQKFRPDVIVVNSGGAYMPGFDTTPILMTEDQAVAVVKASGSAKVIAVHMDALDHCRTTRIALSQNATQAGISTDQLIIPQDGEQVLL